MSVFGLRNAFKEVVKTTAKVSIAVAKEAVHITVGKNTLHNIHQEMKKGWADALTSDKHWLEDDSSGSGDSGRDGS